MHILYYIMYRVFFVPLEKGGIMNISSSAPVSGMKAASLQVDNTAHNVANVNTRGFAPHRLEQAETVQRTQDAQQAQTPRGVQTGADTYEPGAGTRVYSAGTEQPDLARDMTDLTTERNSYTANARTVQVQNEVLGTTIDLVR